MDENDEEQIDSTWQPIPYPPWTGSHLPGLHRRLRRFFRVGKVSKKAQAVDTIILAVVGVALFASPRLLALTPLGEIVSPAGALMLCLLIAVINLLMTSRWMRLTLYSPFKPPARFGGKVRRRRR